MRQNSVFALVIGSALVLLPFLVMAQSKPTEEELARAKALFEEGEKYFYTGSFEEAAAKYKEAYLVVPAPKLLTNTALCYWKLGNYEEALHLYEAYLHTDPAPEDRRKIEGYIGEIKELIEQAKTLPAKERTFSGQPNLEISPALSMPDSSANSRTKGSPRSHRVFWIVGGATVAGGIATVLTLLLSQPLPETDLGFVSVFK